MESARTTPIACRLENEAVAQIKQYALTHGTTVSSTVAAMIRREMPRLVASQQDA